MAAADDEPSPEIVDIYEICSALRTAGIGFTHMHSSTGIESLHVMAADGSYMAVGLNETDADGSADGFRTSSSCSPRCSASCSATAHLRRSSR
jgi:hypothetical protein